MLAACEGMIALFNKTEDSHLHVISQGKNSISPSLEEFRTFLENAASCGKFSQLIIVGAAHDIAWMRLSLPETLAGFIVAEIQYPLLSAWFRQPPELMQLSKALEQVFTA